MNYIGSKLSLIDFLDESIHRVVDKNCKIFCDLFAGTGSVGTHFKKKGYKIISNDIQYYSFVLNRHYVGNHKKLKFSNLYKELPEIKNVKLNNRREWICNYLTNLSGTEGFIYNNYCLGGTKDSKQPRQYFSDENGKLCDTVRLKIEAWFKKGFINNDEYYFLITSLVESIDKYANTASVYGAFLKKLKESARKKLVVKPSELILNDQDHEVYNEDINNLAKKIKGDILYLDPPYNHRQYATNYHLLETIAKYDKPIIYGKTGLREYSKQKSEYCSKAKAEEVFTDLIEKANVKYIFLSYNNEGILSPNKIKSIMKLRGEYGVFQKEYNRFKSDKNINRSFKATKTIEYLHYVICNK